MNIEPAKAASAFAGLPPSSNSGATSRRDRRPLGKLVPNPKAKLRDQFHEVARFKYFSQRTEQTYVGWARRF